MLCTFQYSRKLQSFHLNSYIAFTANQNTKMCPVGCTGPCDLFDEYDGTLWPAKSSNLNSIESLRDYLEQQLTLADLYNISRRLKLSIHLLGFNQV